MMSQLPADPMPDEILIDVETTEAERCACVRAIAARLTWPAARPGLALNLVIWMFIGAMIALAFQARDAWLFLWPVPVSLGLVWAAALFFGRQQVRRAARAQPVSYRLGLRADGLGWKSELACSQLEWRVVAELQRREDALAIWLRDYNCLWIPWRCFPDAALREAFMARLTSATGLPLTGPAPDARALPDEEPAHTDALQAPSARAGLLALGNNLLAGLLFALLRREAPARLRPSFPQFLALYLLGIAIAFVAQWLGVGSQGELASTAPLFSMALLASLILTAWVCVRVAGREGGLLQAATAFAAITVCMTLVSAALALLPRSAWDWMGDWGQLLWWAPLAWLSLATIVGLVRSIPVALEDRVGVVLAVIYLCLVPRVLLVDFSSLWVPRYDPADEAAERKRWEQSTQEDVLYRQPRLLDEALAKIAPGRPGVPELYLVSVAGHGAQDVFKREVLSVDRLFAERFGTSGRNVVLVNNPDSVLERPMATRTALERTLKAVGQRMNADEDVLFLFLTSHGAKDFRFDLSLWPYAMHELSPEVLRRLLDEAGIRQRVIVVSACYSGGFVPRLADPDTLVMSASRADRNSHGCSHEADWTFFGKAFFDEALRTTRSFTAAFELARTAVARRESEEGLEGSEPQIVVGERIAKALKPFEASGH